MKAKGEHLWCNFEICLLKYETYFQRSDWFKGLQVALWGLALASGLFYAPIYYSMVLSPIETPERRLHPVSHWSKNLVS
jgi:hypothetical protein